MNILYASDNNYVPIAGVSLTSLLENNQHEREIKIFYLDDNISDENRDKIFRTVAKYHREIEFIDVEPYLDIMKELGAKTWFNGSMCAYARLFIEDIFKDRDLDRILYLDCDTVVNKNISELYTSDLHGKVCGAVCDYIAAGIRKIDGLSKNDYYFNSGVLLIDVNKWMEEKVQDTIISHMKNVRAQYPYIDQDIINCTLHGNIQKLPMRYNVFPYYFDFTLKQIHFMYGLNGENQYSMDEYDRAIMNPDNAAVIHFTATFHGKPWAIGNDNPGAKIWNQYCNISEWKDSIDRPIHRLSTVTKIQCTMFKKAPRFVFLLAQRVMARRNMKQLIRQYQ